MVNTFRYGLTTIKEDIVGLQQSSQVSFRNIDNFDALTASSARDIPTHSFVNDLAWVKGAHTWKFGANVRFSRWARATTSTRSTFPTPTALGGWRRHDLYARLRLRRLRVVPSGSPKAACRHLATPSCPCSASFLRPPRTTTTIAKATCSVGEPVRRRFATDEYEFYVQDSWKVGDSLTFSAGLRYSLFSPPYETSGLQVTPDIKLATGWRFAGS
jgi:outer membrane receptor protein involved in Fe transport